MSQPRIAVLGVTGMLGHKMFQRLSERFPEVFGVSRALVTSSRFRDVELLRNPRILQGIEAQSWDGLQSLLWTLRPDYIVNCIGIVKQRQDASALVPSLLINSMLPHRLAETAAKWDGRVIHFSTDCVFSGRQGQYREEDPSDAQDLYGRSKFLGEVTSANALTLRTSIIGRELAEFRSLLEWFLAQRGSAVRGFKCALYSGVTTNYLAGLVGSLIESHPALHGLYQVAGQTISKHDLLCLVREVFRLDIEIEPVEGETCDRTLRADRFLAATGYRCPGWPDMIAELYEDPTPYEAWRTVPYETTFQTV
jgi:dTDP-4-dehydrorhamnose reductase